MTYSLPGIVALGQMLDVNIEGKFRKKLATITRLNECLVIPEPATCFEGHQPIC